jgi:hypothetical protein
MKPTGKSEFLRQIQYNGMDCKVLTQSTTQEIEPIGGILTTNPTIYWLNYPQRVRYRLEGDSHLGGTGLELV